MRLEVSTAKRAAAARGRRRQFAPFPEEWSSTGVARLIAQGLSNNEIAERLGVRFFTARNHVERTLAKLGVATRHRVGPLLRNEAADPSDASRASAA